MRFPCRSSGVSKQCLLVFFGWLTAFATAQADYKLDVGYTALVARLGAATPTGAGVLVSQIEAPASTSNDLLAEFGRSRFHRQDHYGCERFGFTSVHATIVGRFFYGNSGIAKGVTQVQSFEVESWFINQMNCKRRYRRRWKRRWYRITVMRGSSIQIRIR